MSRARAACLMAALALLLFPYSTASPLGLATHMTAGDSEYTVEDAVVDVSGTLTFTNLGLRSHDVVAVADGPSDNPWCGRYVMRGCPLFASPVVDFGGQAAVEGTAALQPLSSYAFYCTLHPWMVGTLTAI